MNWDAIGAVGEILGAVAVFVSLIYLASQIKASNRLSRIEGRELAVQRLNDWRNRLLDDKLGSVFHRGCKNPQSLDPDEFRQFHQIVHELLMNIRVQFMRAYDLNHSEEIERMESICKNWSELPRVVEIWKQDRTPLEKPCLEMMERYFGPRKGKSVDA